MNFIEVVQNLNGLVYKNLDEPNNYDYPVFTFSTSGYPEIKDFVKTINNVTWLHPVKYDRKKREYVRTNFKEVVDTYGYPVVSKNVSRQLSDVQRLGEKCWAIRCFNGDEKGVYNMQKWSYLINAPFKISNKCCDIMKKNPLHQYDKKGLKPIIATMACESRQRKNNWLKRGCNTFNGVKSSQPMSFWTEQDVLQYIKQFNIPYASIYGDIVEDKGKLITTGENRTGCMFCMFGCHLEKEPNRFQRMKTTHPKLYDYCIRPIEENGLGLGKILDFIGVKY